MYATVLLTNSASKQKLQRLDCRFTKNKMSLLKTTVLSFSVLSAVALPSTKRYYEPELDGYRLDWCKEWGNNCGYPAALAYCEAKGYRMASSYPKDNNIGETTKVFNSGQLCSSSHCDSFRYIDCSQPKFVEPKYEGYRLDWCKNFAAQCGEPAADEFCQAHGFSQATTWAIDHNIGTTKLIGDADELYTGSGSLCTASWCDGFAYIYCS